MSNSVEKKVTAETFQLIYSAREREKEESEQRFMTLQMQRTD